MLIKANAFGPKATMQREIIKGPKICPILTNRSKTITAFLDPIFSDAFSCEISNGWPLSFIAELNPRQDIARAVASKGHGIMKHKGANDEINSPPSKGRYLTLTLSR